MKPTMAAVALVLCACGNGGELPPCPPAAEVLPAPGTGSGPSSSVFLVPGAEGAEPLAEGGEVLITHALEDEDPRGVPPEDGAGTEAGEVVVRDHLGERVANGRLRDVGVRERHSRAGELGRQVGAGGRRHDSTLSGVRPGCAPPQG